MVTILLLTLEKKNLFLQKKVFLMKKKVFGVFCRFHLHLQAKQKPKKVRRKAFLKKKLISVKMWNDLLSVVKVDLASCTDRLLCIQIIFIGNNYIAN